MYNLQTLNQFLTLCLKLSVMIASLSEKRGT